MLISLWKTLVQRLLANDQEVDSASNGTHAETRPVSSLYRCPGCDTVTVGVDREACFGCRFDLREVPDTL